MKSNAIFTIGEAAFYAGITRRIILNYEAKGLIFPDRKDGESGNRFYTSRSLRRIRTVRALQNEGLSLDEIREYLNGNLDLLTPIHRLEKMRDELNRKIELLYERVHAAQNDSKSAK